MKTKQIIILAIILGVLIAGIFWKHLQKPPEFVSEEYAALNLSFDDAKATKIEISKGKGAQAVVLIKQNGRWNVPDFFGVRADQVKIDALLKTIRQAKGELRGKDKSLFHDFGLSEEDAYRLNILDAADKPLLTLLIGTKKPASESTFLRKDGSDSVYLAAVNLFREIGIWTDPAQDSPKADYWSVLNLTDLKIDQVEKLETKRFVDGRETLTSSVIRQTDPNDSAKKKWQFVRPETPFAPDAEKIKQFLGILNHVQGTKALDPKAKDYGFSKPYWQMKLGLEGGGEVVLLASQQDAETKARFIQVSDQPVVFQLPGYHFQNIDIDDSKFFADNPLSIDPEKTEKLTVHADAKEFTVKPKEKKWDSLTGYLNDLKTFSASRLLFDSSERKAVQSPSRYWLEIQREGGTYLIDVGSALSGPQKEYAAKKRGDNTQPFAVPEALYKKLFDQLDRLNQPK